MPDLSEAQIAALAEGRVMRRLFFWCDALDLDGNPDPVGLWDDIGPITVGGKTYQGSGTLGAVDSISAQSDLSITPLVLTLSGISSKVASLVRGSMVAQRPMSLSIGIYDPTTQELIGSLVTAFKGFADDIDIKTPKSGGTATITLTCESTSRESTISSTDTRSHDSQKKRLSSDDFFKYAEATKQRPIFFGRKEPRRSRNRRRQ